MKHAVATVLSVAQVKLGCLKEFMLISGISRTLPLLSHGSCRLAIEQTEQALREGETRLR